MSMDPLTGAPTASAAPAPKPKLRPATIFRFIIGVITVVLIVSMVLTQLTTVDASSCELEERELSREGERPKIPDGVPVYLEVMSGDNELNKQLRAGLEAALPGHEIVERSARHAPKGAAGVKVIVSTWAPKWFPLRAGGATTIEAEVRVGQQKQVIKGELGSHCLGIVNKDGFLQAERDRMLDWAKKALAL
jgi:hypothetical protein